jgi:hypothetical protein
MDTSTLSIKGACILVYSSQQKRLSVYEVSANVGYLEKTICLRREIRIQKKMQNLRESNIIITFFDKKKNIIITFTSKNPTLGRQKFIYVWEVECHSHHCTIAFKQE